MNTEILTQIDTLIRREVVPATGCTEPACVALAVAYVANLLDKNNLEHIEVSLSANMLKNAMGVGIPGTGMIGIPIAIALGAVVARPERGLMVMEGFDEATLDEAKALVERGIIKITLCQRGDIDKLYVEVVASDAEGHQARCIIDRTHTGMSLLELDGKVLECRGGGEPSREEQCSEHLDNMSLTSEDIALTFDMVYDYATTAPLEMLEFIHEAAQVNKSVGAYALDNKYGHNIGRSVQSAVGRALMGSSPLTRMIAYTSGACDARMGGAPMTVMSNSGSGNQGITATLPVLTFAESQEASYETTVRALMMSSLMVVYIKQQLGRLSGLCGMVVSGVGTAAALVYIMGGTRQQSGYAIQNMVGNVTGMICDGAKPGCSLKATSGISAAMISAMLAMEHQHCTSLEGVVHEDVDASIRNLAFIGREAMQETDRKVLELMLDKGK